MVNFEEDYMAKVPAPFGVPFSEDNNYTQGKSGADTPKTMGPAVGNVQQGNPTKSGGINRGTQSFNTSVKKGL